MGNVKDGVGHSLKGGDVLRMGISTSVESYSIFSVSRRILLLYENSSPTPCRCAMFGVLHIRFVWIRTLYHHCFLICWYSGLYFRRNVSICRREISVEKMMSKVISGRIYCLKQKILTAVGVDCLLTYCGQQSEDCYLSLSLLWLQGWWCNGLWGWGIYGLSEIYFWG